LAGALPLLADDKNLEQLHHRTGERLNRGEDELLDVPSNVVAAAATTTTTTTLTATTLIAEDDENDSIPFSAVEAMHDDGFRIPPLPRMVPASEENVVVSQDVGRSKSSDDDKAGGTSKAESKPDDATVKKREDKPTRTNTTTTTATTAPDPPEQKNQEGKEVDSLSNEATATSSPSEAGILLDKVTSVVEQIIERVVSSSMSSFHPPTTEEGTTTGTKESLTSNDPERVEAPSVVVGEMLDLVEEVPPIPSTSKPENETASSDEDFEKNAAETNANKTLGMANSEGETIGTTTVHGTLEENYNKTNTSNPSNETAVLSDDEKPLVQPESQNSTSETIKATKQPAEDDEESLTGRVAVDYASKSAGALILERSNTIKGTSNLLNGDKDRYAIAPCEDKKFVVIGLSEDILVKQIVLANYERFSSPVKDFQVMGSQTMGKFVDLGTFSALAVNGEQTFDLVEPAWARYLKFKFRSHHGSEYYCTLSQIKVHGSTMLQGFHEQWEDSEQQEGNKNDNQVVEEPSATTNEAPPSASSGNSSCC
jgi:Sad1 / UNC-like C-terminal